MRDDAALVEFAPPIRFYDPNAPLDKALPDTLAADGLKRADVNPPAEPASLVPGIVADLAISRDDHAGARLSAERNGTDVGSELVAAGRVSEVALAAALARALDLPMEPILDGDRIVRDPRRPDRGPARAGGRRPPRLVKTCDFRLNTKIFLAPRIEDMDATRRVLAAHPEQRALARIATPRAIAARFAAASAARREEAARLSLSRDRPELSARHVLTGLQGMTVAAILFALLLSAIAWPASFFGLVHLLAIPLFLGCVGLRLAAGVAASPPGVGAPEAPGQGRPAGPHPVYTVLVALHHEKDVVPDLVAALARLRWPRSKLEVMLVCEGDDCETLAAARATIAGQPGFEIVVVPPSLPRTKPKALNFALPLASGEFLVLYDAEDRPRPDQLETAWRRFSASGRELACLQAPLIVVNGEANWLAGHFALEYAALFRGFLPFLAKSGLPLPLGGTSNHFRRETLVEVGGWDSHNVTEDADLGIRLCRAGYRIGTIDAPTFEEAPERFVDWRNQRTRWMKGWLQTWLVHMRDPFRLQRDLGLGGFVSFHLLFFGMVASTLAHPFFLVFLAYTVWTATGAGLADPVTRLVIAADLFNLVLAYLSVALLAFRTLDAAESRTLARRFWSLYVYWLLISFASARAFVQLVRDPHKWEKTPHGAAARADAPPENGVQPRREPLFDVPWT